MPACCSGALGCGLAYGRGSVGASAVLLAGAGDAARHDAGVGGMTWFRQAPHGPISLDGRARWVSGPDADVAKDGVRVVGVHDDDQRRRSGRRRTGACSFRPIHPRTVAPKQAVQQVTDPCNAGTQFVSRVQTSGLTEVLRWRLADVTDPVPCLMWRRTLLLDMNQLAQRPRAERLRLLIAEIGPAGWLDYGQDGAVRRQGDAQRLMH